MVKRMRGPARKRSQDRGHAGRERAAERGKVSASQVGMGATGTTGTAKWRGPGTSEDAPTTISAER